MVVFPSAAAWCRMPRSARNAQMRCRDAIATPRTHHRLRRPEYYVSSRRRMVTEYKSAAIVMLTPPSEGPTAKCWQYFAPEEGGSVTFSSGGEDFTVLTR